MIKVDTVEQFKVLQFIESNFEMNCIAVEKVSRDILEVNDSYGKSMDFRWDRKQNKVVSQEGE